MPARKFTMRFLVLSLCTVLVKYTAAQSNQQPSVTGPLGPVQIAEITPPGTVIFNITAVDPEGQNVWLSDNPRQDWDPNIEMIGPSPVYFNLIQTKPNTATVVLIKELDSDTVLSNVQIAYYVYMSDSATPGGSGNIASHQFTISVRDSNDEVPEFLITNWAVDIRENAPKGTVLIPMITVQDKDRDNPSLSHECKYNEKYKTACDMFEFTRYRNSTNRFWYGKMLLKGTLDFETQNVYQYSLVVTDGLNSKTQSIEVNVIDEQDVPPDFVHSGKDEVATIDEETPVNYHVLTVEAVDGDTLNPRSISYEICDSTGPQSGNGYFKLDSTTGRLSVAKRIDRENLQTSQVIKICARAREIINPVGPDLGDDPTTTATAVVTVTIRDINDNTPTFEQDSYTVYIKEDIYDGTALPGLQLDVSDLDEGRNAYFDLVITNTDKQIRETFSVSPKPGEAQGSASGTISVENTNLIDYEKRYQQYVILVEARETSVSNPKTGTATVTVNVLDVNDNAPTFGKTAYQGQVKEDAKGGHSILQISATDPDSGSMGTNGLVYSLFGNGADKFVIDSQLGIITVKDCPTPGSGDCIDYEKKNLYDLIGSVRDMNGDRDGKQTLLPVTIKILNTNDNAPVFEMGNYRYEIIEGDTVLSPQTPIKATDADGINTVITYSFVNPNSIFELNSRTGHISARQPVDFEATPNGKGFYYLDVEASDGDIKVTGMVTIKVIDQNDNAPVFKISNYETSIKEDAGAGTEVITVQADDVDAGQNGVIAYNLFRGTEDKFSINSQSGTIRVVQGATFDVDIKDRYILLVKAADQGENPRLTATGTVTVTILDANNKDPYFQPPTTRFIVREDAPVGKPVGKMTAMDPDSGANITYDITGTPKQAWDLAGNRVASTDYDYTNLFRVDTFTGEVYVNGPLDYNQAQTIQYDINAYDNSADPVQTGVGSILFLITQVNKQPPIFVLPWTLPNPVYNITVRENLPRASFVKAMIATDPDGIVTRYTITEDPLNYFDINSATGVVTMSKPFDYEQITSTYYVVEAMDSGSPAKTATATVYVNVANVNDFQPRFDNTVYKKEIPENSQENSYVLTVSAADGDFGSFGVVTYRIDGVQNEFKIDPVTGEIRVKEGAVLDRETKREHSFTVTAFDTPDDPTQRKSMTIPVYITLTDINDNYPEFSTKNYSATIIESIPIKALVVQMEVTDEDAGINQKIRFEKISGDPAGLFFVNPQTGRISTQKAMIDRVGVHFLTIKVTDKDGAADGLSDISYVKITVVDANNEPPVWIYPDTNYVTINVLENQYRGLEVTTVSAMDPEGAPVEYGFKVDGEFSRTHPLTGVKFRINHITGIISAEQVFDRETKDFYTLQLMARDMGREPVLTAERILTVLILDTDDHTPEFPTELNGETKPYFFSVKENAKVGTFVGKVTATDKDIGKHAIVSYMIDNKQGFVLNGRDTYERFKIDSSTGVISTNKVLDRENLARHKLNVKAFNNYSDDSVVVRRRRELSPDYVDVYIDVIDEDDSEPKFIIPDERRIYYAFLPYDSPLHTLVLTVSAIDKDNNPELVFNITNIVERINGTRRTNKNADGIFRMKMEQMQTQKLVSNKKDMNYKTQLSVSDVNMTVPADSITWITHPYQEMRLTVGYSVDEATTYKSSIIDFVSSATNGGLVWIYDIRYNVDKDMVYEDRSDVLLYVADLKTERLLSGIELDYLLEKGMAGVWATKAGLANVIAVNGAGSGVVGAVIDWWPVVWALVAFLIVLALALLLLLLCCCCPCCRRCCVAFNEKDRVKRLEYRKTMSEKQRIRSTTAMTGQTIYYSPAWDNKTFSNLAYEHDAGMSVTHRSSMHAGAATAAAYNTSQRQTLYTATNTAAIARASTRKDTTADENYTIVSDVLPARDETDKVVVVAAAASAIPAPQSSTTTTTTTKRTSYMSNRDAVPLPPPTATSTEVLTVRQPAPQMVNTEYTVVADLPKIPASMQAAQQSTTQYTVVNQPITQQYQTTNVQRTNTIQAVPMAPDQGNYTVLTDLNLPRTMSLPPQPAVQQTQYVEQRQIVDQGRGTSFKVVTDLPFSSVSHM